MGGGVARKSHCLQEGSETTSRKNRVEIDM